MEIHLVEVTDDSLNETNEIVVRTGVPTAPCEWLDHGFGYLNYSMTFRIGYTPSHICSLCEIKSEVRGHHSFGVVEEEERSCNCIWCFFIAGSESGIMESSFLPFSREAPALNGLIRWHHSQRRGGCCFVWAILQAPDISYI